MHALFEGREIKKEVVEVISEQQRQGWTAVNHELEESEAAKATKEDAPPAGREDESRHHTESTIGDTMDGEALDDEDLDGEALEEEDLDGEALEDEELDGEALDDDDL